jgi:signal peptidase I
MIGVGINYSVDTALQEHVIKAYKIPAGSMEPTIMMGDHLLCNRLYYQTRNPARGDIIIFEYPQNERMDFIKRVIGLPGDSIEIWNNEVYVNGNKLEEPYAVYREAGRSLKPFGPVVVPEDEYFVLGDNRDNSNDSRYWGTVKRHKIRGKAIFIYFSWDMQKPWWNIFGRLFSIRFSRIGDIIQ